MLSLRILQALVKRHTPTLGRVVKSVVILAQSIQLLDILVLNLALQCAVVLRDARLVAALRDSAGSAAPSPLQRDLCGSALALLGDVEHNGVVEKLWRLALGVCRVSAGEGRVRGNVDAVRGVVLDPLVLLQIRVQFHLVHARWVRGRCEQVLELLWVEVGYADVAGLAFLDELGHRVPSLLVLDLVAEFAACNGPVHEIEV